MIGRAIEQMLQEQADERDRHVRREASRRPDRIVDRWLDAVEALLEREQDTVPEPLFREIGAFLQEHTPSLSRKLRRNRRRDPVRVLDVLFDAQAELKDRRAEVSAASGVPPRTAVPPSSESGVVPPA